MTPPPYRYEVATSRNIGWLSSADQERLRGARVAIAGMGGVGGVHALTLARLGIGAFHLADFDRFDVANFNRQAGAFVHTLGQPKVEVMASQVRAINPGASVQLFPTGVQADNLDAFLDGVDVFVDGLDFFAFDARQMVFGACHARGIPAVTAAPLGMSVALLNFLPGRMSFDEYFDLRPGQSRLDKALRLALGLAPAGLHRAYLVDPSTVSFARAQGPSTAMACELCAGVASTEVLKLLLGRGRVRAAPHGLQFDAYSGRLRRTWRPGGNRHPLQRLQIALGRRFLARHDQAA